MYVKYIDLSDKQYSEYTNSENSTVNLEKTNIFIGKNNSGKSRLMRQVLISEYNKNYYINDNFEDFIELKQNIENMLKGMSDYVIEKYKETYLSKENIREKVYRNEEDEEKLGMFICNLLYYEENDAMYRKLQGKRVVKNSSSFSRDFNFPQNNGKRDMKSKIREVYSKIIDEKQDVRPNTIYFPAFLSLRKLDNIDVEKEPQYHTGISNMFFKDYFAKLKDFDNIKTGQEIYLDMKKQLLGLNRDRERFLKYEEYISKNFFDNKEISIFIKDDDKNIYIKEEDENEYPIYMLGDGLQTLITITYYLFMNNDTPLKVFIDEPEVHLHPGLQRLLISKLQEYKNCQYFISTHSSSMIDICDEYDKNTSIVCVDKVECEKMAYNSAYDDMNLYDLIGVRPSSIILSNCTIWVEGPTDIYYIDTFLKLYSKLKNKKQFILGYNYNYAFNGSINIASKIDFDNDETSTMKIKKLSKNNFIIFDSDNLNKENANYEKIQNLKTKLGESCYVIKKLKTIENIVPPRILKEYFKDNYNSKDKKIKPIVLAFFDHIMKEYGTDNYSQMDIADEMAEYINKHIDKKEIKKYRKYCNSLWSSNKYNLAIYFSNKIANMQDEEKKEIFEEIMSGFINMINKIYKFIENNNK